MGPLSVMRTCQLIEWRKLFANFLFLICAVILMFPSLGHASDAQLVTWDTLIPAITQNNEPADLSTVPHVGQTPLQSSAPPQTSGSFDPLFDGTSGPENWKSQDVDASPVILDKRVLIDGYVLPLAWEGTRVVDFLLVPWVGACIHMPTPPPNQIIHVSYPDGISLEKQFEAVRLAGVLRNVEAEHNLFLVDGQRNISVSYALEDAARSGSPGKVIAMSADDLPKLAKVQIWINALFTDSMRAIADDASTRALIFALLISFGYGVLHTLGPGHGKSVVISYFVGTGGSLRRGLSMGVQIAVVHVLSAIVVVTLLDFAVRQTTGAAPSEFRAIRLGSYALIILIGAVMLWQAISALVARRREVANAGPVHVHAYGHGHATHAHSGCSACAAAAAQSQGNWIAASVGLVPCTGALLVMLFGLANDLVLPAVLMVISISAGMALSLSAIGVIAIYGRRLAEQRFSGSTNRGVNFDIGARIVGSGCILAIGVLLFVLTVSYPPVLQAPVNEVSASHGENILAPG